MKRIGSNFVVALAGMILAGAPALLARTHTPNGVDVSGPVTPKLSVPLGSLPKDNGLGEPLRKLEDRENPLANEPDHGRRGTWNRAFPPQDPLAAAGFNPNGRTPSPTRQWDGTGNPAGCGGCSPPDIVGDIGPHHYIQIVNATKIAIYDKVGTLLSGPTNLSTFWTSGNCHTNAGDPVVVYDILADRWLLVQFASPHDICIAISQSGDPLGSYFIYDFNANPGGFPDYYKVGVWPDGYYMTANQSSYTAMVVDRSKMLNGLAATIQHFTTTTDVSHVTPANFLLPAQFTGLVPPPAGAPGMFYTFLDDAFHGVAADEVQLYALHADFVTPANSTFLVVGDLVVAPFTYTVCGFFNFDCVPQKDTAQLVDALSEWPMWRLNYRNFGDHESLVSNFAVAIATPPPPPLFTIAAPRWFELQRVGAGAWTLFQQGTYNPADNNWRWMASIASDHYGDLALGFSESSASLNPRIRYATRLSTDTPGTLGPEVALLDPAGSQTASNRWGDYTTMSVDPTNDCDFYFTDEYYSANSAASWQTRIGVFTIPQCNVIFLDGFEIATTNRWSSAVP